MNSIDEEGTGGRFALHEELIAQYQTTRIRSFWTYKRILQLTKNAIITIDPNKFTVTNTFPYENIFNIVIDEKNNEAFSFEMEKIVYTYSCPYRSHLLCQLYECMMKYSNSKFKKIGPIDAARIRKSGVEQRCKILVSPYGIIETDIYNTTIQEYKWYNISKIGFDDSNYAVYFEDSGRLKVFVAAEYSQLINGIRMHIKSVGLDNIPFFNNQKLHAITQARNNLYSSIPIAVSVFEVNKLTKRYPRPVPRQIHISEEFILEMDSAGFQPISFHKISSIYALVRSWENPREFRIEFDNGLSSKFTSAQRDTLLAMLLDVCRASGNLKVIVTGEISDGLRLMPRFAEELYQASIKDAFFGSSSIETWYLTKLSKICKQNLDVDPVVEVCCELNANIPCPGISTTADATLVKTVLVGLLIVIQNEVIKSLHSFKANNARAIAVMLQTMYRIIPSIHGYKSFVEVKEVDTRNLLFQLLKYDHDFVNYWALEIYMSLCRCPLTPRNMQQEFVNKHTLIYDKTLIGLMDLMSNRLSTYENQETNRTKLVSEDEIKVPTSSENDRQSDISMDGTTLRSSFSEAQQPLFSPTTTENPASNPSTSTNTAGRKFSEDVSSEPVISDGTLAYLDSVHFVPNSLVVIGAAAVLESLVCSKKDTTSPELFQLVLDILAERCEVLIIMLRSNSFIIMENAAILMFILMKHRPTVNAFLKELALSEGLVLKHFYSAVFSPSSTQRFISRFLIATWMNGSIKSNPAKALLFRMIPSGLVEYLKFEPISDEHRTTLDVIEEEFYGKISGQTRRQKLTSNANDTSVSVGTMMQQRMRSRISGAIKEPGEKSANTSAAVGNETSKPAKIPENYRVMFHVMTQDHKLPDLIWNEQTRLELRSALEHEIKEYDREQRLLGSKKIAWNFQQFMVRYESLGVEMKVGPIYIKYFLEAGESFLRALDNPNHALLFEKLFRRILVNVESNSSMAILCTKCLNRLYEVCSDIIGSFDDMIIIVKMLEQATNLELQQLLFDLIIILSKDQTNLLQLLDKHFVDIIVKYISLAHINPDQIGNVLARATSSTLLITNSSNSDPSVLSDFKPNLETSNEKTEEEINRQFRKSLWVPDDFACPRVWYAAPPQITLPPSRQVQKGPLRVSELLNEVEAGRIGLDWIVAPTTTEEADDESFSSVIDTGRWKCIDDVFQLRLQMLFPGKALYSPAEISFKGIKLLQQISQIHKSSNTKGIPFYPLPMSKRIMSDHHHLVIFAQLLLSNDPNVVDLAAEILKSLVEFNSQANSKLYLTGVFFFASRYSGNNYMSIANLFSITHLNQSFHDSAISMAKEVPIHIKSILGTIFPPAMISILSNYGPEKFASIMIGDFDTPEVIWNSKLRQHMIEMINQHLSDFPLRLKQFTLLQYDYCPIPKIHYAALDKEIYVYEYYLKNLCNEIKFPDWPIAEPLILLKECLERWRYEMSKDNIDSSIEDAKKVLGLSGKKITSADLRKAYKNLARIYHPDKNPNGREMFEKIHVAYELLSLNELKENEINYENIILIMKTQIILYRRHSQFINKQKYPAYPLIINVMNCIPTNGQSFDVSKAASSPEEIKVEDVSEQEETFSNAQSISSYTADILLTSSSLLYYTTFVTPLNALEFVKQENGLIRLYELFHYVIPHSVGNSVKTATSPSAQSTFSQLSATAEMNIYQKILLNCVKTFCTIAELEEGRDAIYSTLTIHNHENATFTSSFIEDLYHLLAFYHEIPLVIENVIEIISRLCSHTKLQQTFLTTSGVIWRLVPFLLNYDHTTNELLLKQSLKKKMTDPTDIKEYAPINPLDVLDESQRLAYNQYSSNILAILSAKTLGRLGGYMFDDLFTENNPIVKEVLGMLLTPSVALLLRNRRPWDLLNSLNENVESTTKIWNLMMRKELLSTIQNVDSNRSKGFHDQDLNQIKTSFVYSNLKDELFLSGVYIRIFNKTHDISDIEDPTKFCYEILEFIGNVIIENYSKNLNIQLEKTKEAGSSEGDEQIFDKVTELRKCTPKEINFTEVIPSVQRIYLDHVVESLKILIEARSFIIHDLLQHPHGLLVLFSLLNILQYDSPGFYSLSLIFSNIATIPEFVSICADYNPPVTWRLIKCLCNSPSATTTSASSKKNSAQESFQNLWNATEAIASHTEGLSNLLSSGLIIRLLGTLLGVEGYNNSYQFRLYGISLLTKCLWNSVKGSETSFILRRFLPEPLILLLKKSIGKASLQCIDNIAENPELIWTQEMQGELRQGILDLHKANENKNSSVSGTSNRNIYGLNELIEIPSSDFFIQYQQLLNELYIGNVYIRIYLKSPTFKLSNPIYFMEKLIEFYDYSFNFQVPKKKGPQDISENEYTTNDDSREIVLGKEDFLSLITSSMICNIKNEHTIVEQLISWGFIDTLIKEYLYRINCFQRKGIPLITVLRLLNELLNFNVVLDYIIEKVSSIPTNNLISNLTYALIDEEATQQVILQSSNAPVGSSFMVEDVPDEKASNKMKLYKESFLIIEILKKIFQYYQNPSTIILLNYALQCQLPNLLITYIINASSGDLANLTNGSAVKIQSTDVLKGMLVIANDEMHTELMQLLNQSREWKQFKDQSHDLFITDKEKTDIFLIEDASDKKFIGLLTYGNDTSNVNSSYGKETKRENVSSYSSSSSTEPAQQSSSLSSMPKVFSSIGVSKRDFDNYLKNVNKNARKPINLPKNEKMEKVADILKEKEKAASQQAEENALNDKDSSNDKGFDPLSQLRIPKVIGSLMNKVSDTIQATTGQRSQSTDQSPLVNNNNAPAVNLPGNSTVSDSEKLRVPSSAGGEVYYTVPLDSPMKSSEQPSIPSGKTSAYPFAQSQSKAPSQQILTTTIVKGPHGIGLDLAKNADGQAYILKLKDIPGVVNPASQCNPPMKAGDLIIAVNGQKSKNFMETVNLIRACGTNVQLTFLR